jgi:cytochrome d ubiquinol oxidase subunit I
MNEVSAGLDALMLSRIQFAFTVTFHIIFPSMSIGLAAFLAATEGMWLKTRDELYLRIYRFWVVIFAMGFGVGVVTGIVLSFQFGTNWSRFAQMAGPVLAPMISLEVLTSFFLEAGFLGIMLFGMGRVSRGLHFFATCMVALGTLISASWIMAANSWMQTPAGFVLENGRFVVTDWWQVVFNPSFPYRFVHMVLAAYISASFIVAGIGAWYLVRSRHLAFAQRTVSIALGAATVLVACQVFLGDILAGVMAQHQPAKIQAIEGNWEDRSRADYLLLIQPNKAEQRNDFELGVPLLGSLLVTHSLDGTVEGLKRTPVAQQPNMGMVFYGFRVMFLIGVLMFAVVCVSLWLRLRRRLYDTRWFLWLLVWMTPAGTVATVAGWYTAETGRQPWVVFGQLHTADALSPVVASQVLTSLLLFVAIYLLFGGSFLVLALRRIAKGPEGADGEEPTAVGVVKRGQRVGPLAPASPSPSTGPVAVARLRRS